MAKSIRHRGAREYAGIYSIVTTALANGIKDYSHLEWALTEVPRTENAV